jgi:hypothetical protein
MTHANPLIVKDLIDGLENECGSLRKAAAELERRGIKIPHQTLSNWRSGRSKDLNKFLDALKVIQQILKESDSSMYKKATKK